MRSFSQGLILLLVAVIGVACVEGGTAETPTATSPAVTPTGSDADTGRVDVGGYELFYECRGTGSPTILTEAGYDSAGTSTWQPVFDELAEISRTCAYDRAGTGSSDRRSDAEGLTSVDQAEELHALLVGAGIEPPYVLVGHSYGGFVSRLFATAYANETAGLVLIESSHEDEIGPYRTFYGDSPDGAWVDGGDLLDIDATEAALREARDYGDMPLIAIRAERYEDVLTEQLWRRTQADLATLSTDGVHVVALGSGHFVMEPAENPAVIVTAVEAVVGSALSGEPVGSCEELFAEVDAACP